MAVDVDSMNMSDNVEFDALQTSDLAETMTNCMLERIPLTSGWTHPDLSSLHELMQSSTESFDSQPTGKWPVRMNTIFMRLGSSLPITLLYQRTNTGG